jgi:hypothetical protein
VNNMESDGKEIVNIKKNEKSILITIFCLFFVLSALLIFVMTKKDIQEKEAVQNRMQQTESNTPENIWPKVEIQTRQ